MDPPIQAVLHGRVAVPVWFALASDLEGVMSVGVTIGELAGLPSLKTGSASIYRETLQPTQAAKSPMINFTAKSSLEAGGSFQVHISWNAASGHRNVQINLIEQET